MTDHQSDADARFTRTIDRWFRDRLALEPVVATYLGVHDHDGDLPAASREHVDALVSHHRGAIAEMERFSPEDLSADHALDRDLVIHQGRLALHALTERRTWQRRANAAEEIGEGLFPLFTRDFAPLAERLESIASRLEQAPRVIEEAEARVTEPVRLWAEIDIESAEALPSFLATIVAAAATDGGDPALTRRLEAAADATNAALERHAAHLRDVVLPHATADWKAGPEQFEEIVRLRELEATGDEILAVGEQMLADSIAARNAVCAEIDPTLDPFEVADLVKDDHAATFVESLDEYRTTMDAARHFVIEHDLATVVPDDHLSVIETPSFIRHLVPFAAYYEPAKFDARPTGTYIVTPPSSPEMMREHNRSSISNTSVHEAYPGHHLQLSAAVTNPSLVRLFSDSPEFAEGWAFYCERMMKEAGFDDTPKGWYVVHTDAIWRACRILLDVRLHRGEIGFDEAVDFMQERTGFERPAVVAEVKRYTSTPAYQLSYLYGRYMIERLRADAERSANGTFSPKAFHDTLLYGGTMPVSYARRLFPSLAR
jgi:uncharacterized protein (DUF885 family)